MQQKIAEVSDEATRKYVEETPEGERSDFGITAAMRARAKSKVESYKGQFSKYLTIANPKLGNEFFEEVSETSPL